MSAVKQPQIQQQHFFYPQQKTVDLTKQERQALSLVWTEMAASSTPLSRQEHEVAHCAELGYN